MLSTVSRLEVPGTVAQSLSFFREADLIQHWVPFVSGCGNYPSEKLPAIIGTLRAKIPILPRSLNSLVHRAFVDSFDSQAANGVLLVEWTPTPEEMASGHYCGMVFPPGQFNMTVKQSTTLVQSEGEGRCSIVMRGENDFKVSRRFLPDVVVRKFLTMNSKVLAQRICSCLEDLSGKGYLQRLQSDSQGFYGIIERRFAENASRC